MGVFNASPFDKRLDYSHLFKTVIYLVCTLAAINSVSGRMPLEEISNYLLLSVPSTWNESDDRNFWLAVAGLDHEILKFGLIFDNYPRVREAVLNNRDISGALVQTRSIFRCLSQASGIMRRKKLAPSPKLDTFVN